MSIDLAATVEGESVEDAQRERPVATRSVSGSLLDGLDEAVTGLSAGESAAFTTALVGGDHAGEEAEVTVTVNSVKERELPELDDEFAQTASEFDTLDELRDDLRTRFEQMQTARAGRAGPRQGPRGAAREGRRAAAGGRRRSEIESRQHALRAAARAGPA